MAQVDFAKRGIDIGSLSLNLPNMMKQKEEAVKQLTSGIGILFNKNKVAFLLCTNSFLSPPPSVSKLDSSLLKELNLQKDLVLRLYSLCLLIMYMYMYMLKDD